MFTNFGKYLLRFTFKYIRIELLTKKAGGRIMTAEEKIKELILIQYKSLRDFINNSGIDMPYTTLDGILKRGVSNASISNVLKLCKALNISADELSKGNIVPINSDDPIMNYAKKLSALPKPYLDTVLMYIDYCESKAKEKGLL